MGLDYDTVKNHCSCSSGAECVTDTQCQQLLQKDVDSAAAAAQSLANVCACEEAVVTDLAYNLGKAGLSQFTTFLGYMNNQQWSQAASDLRGTLWCRQVGGRCTRDTGLIENGC